jgi:hypothetical protein
VTLSFADERHVLTMIQPMLHLYECADPVPVEFAAKPLHSIGDSAAVEESTVEPLHSAADPATAKSTDEPLQSVANLDAAADGLTETSCS